jgi:hypothetical protein
MTISRHRIVRLGARTACGALLLFAALANAPLTSTAHAVELTPQQVASYEAASEGERVKLMITLANNGQADMAALLLSRYPLRGPFAANRKLFIEGLILRSHRNLTGAVAKFRAALASDPGLTLVRAELAKTLVALDETDSAKHQLKMLMADAPDETQAQGVKSFIDALDAKRPFTYSTYLSVAPSTNVNSGSNLKNVYTPYGNLEISPDSQKKSGLGVSAGGNVGYSHRLGNDFSVVLAAGLDGRIYSDHKYNTYSASQSAELRTLMENGYLGLGVVGSENFLNNQIGLGYYSYGPRVSLQHNFTPKDQLNLSAVHEWRKYKDQPSYDGTALSLFGSWDHSMAADMGVTLTGGYDLVKTEFDFDSYKAYSAGLGFYKELPKGITANLYAGIRTANFDGVFPLYAKVRHDDRYTANLRVMKRDWNVFGYAPELSYTYVYNDSNIGNYKFDSHTVDFRLSKDF